MKNARILIVFDFSWNSSNATASSLRAVFEYTEISSNNTQECTPLAAARILAVMITLLKVFMYQDVTLGSYESTTCKAAAEVPVMKKISEEYES